MEDSLGNAKSDVTLEGGVDLQGGSKRMGSNWNREGVKTNGQAEVSMVGTRRPKSVTGR